MPRAADLPEFGRPPINEVVLGIQFNKPPRYQLIFAGEVYQLFRPRFSRVEEQAPLPPVFETFGAPVQQMLDFQIMNRPDHPRFWFLDETGHELLQFQQDRFLHNWRQVDLAAEAIYPRYKNLRQSFSEELEQLDNLFRRGDASPLSINQVEVSYYNRIYGDGPSTPPRPDEWVKFLNFGDREPEGFNGVYREIIRGDDGKPKGRLYIEINSTVDAQGRRMIVLSFTARGAPPESDRETALATLDLYSDLIVRTFARITTDDAHKKWERKR